MNIGVIRSGLADRIKVCTNVERAYAFMPDSLVLPCAVIAPGETFVSYPETINRGTSAIMFRVILFASRSSDKSGQALIDTWLATGSGLTTSVVEALHDNTVPLGGGARTVLVEQATDYGIWADSSGVEYFKCDLMVKVMANRVE